VLLFPLPGWRRGLGRGDPPGLAARAAALAGLAAAAAGGSIPFVAAIAVMVAIVVVVSGGASGSVGGGARTKLIPRFRRIGTRAKGCGGIKRRTVLDPRRPGRIFRDQAPALGNAATLLLLPALFLGESAPPLGFLNRFLLSRLGQAAVGVEMGGGVRRGRRKIILKK
jgi:hypothetical protein